MRQLNGRYTQMFNRRHERVGHLFQGRFTAILVEKEAHLLELCRYVILNPVRAKLVKHPRLWAWSSYRATVGESGAPTWVSTGWILSQFGQGVRRAQEQYRTFVAEGLGGPRPWEQLRGQIYLGSDEFIAQHQANRVIQEIPRRQTQAHRPSLSVLFQKRRGLSQLIHEAYRQHGYRLREIATHLGVHYATVSRQLKRAEQDRI